MRRKHRRQKRWQKGKGLWGDIKKNLRDSWKKINNQRGGFFALSIKKGCIKWFGHDTGLKTKAKEPRWY